MMNYLEEYDETDPISIETYAKRLIGKTFADVCKPVSYTHLDVYKRQVELRFYGFFCCLEIYKRAEKNNEQRRKTVAGRVS